MTHGSIQPKKRIVPLPLRTVAARGLTPLLGICLGDIPVDMFRALNRRHRDLFLVWRVPLARMLRRFNHQLLCEGRCLCKGPLVHLVSRLPREVTLAAWRLKEVRLDSNNT